LILTCAQGINNAGIRGVWTSDYQVRHEYEPFDSNTLRDARKMLPPPTDAPGWGGAAGGGLTVAYTASRNPDRRLDQALARPRRLAACRPTRSRAARPPSSFAARTSPAAAAASGNTMTSTCSTATAMSAASTASIPPPRFGFGV
jgi:hypothetical protein